MFHPERSSKSRVARVQVLATVALLAAVALVTGLATNVRAEAFICTPVAVGVFTGVDGQRMHIQCQSPYPASAIYYFAFPTKTTRKLEGSDVEYLPNYNADRFLDLATAAFVNGKKLFIWFDMADLSGTSIGCANFDCRLLRSAVITP